MVHSPDDRVRVLRTQGVVTFVGVQGTGTPIPDHQIEDIKTLITSRISYEERSFLRIGQRVRVCGGALDGMQGILVAENGDRSLVISVELIQRSLYVRVAGYDVEPV
jgi:transcription antitermination factor NusG